MRAAAGDGDGVGTGDRSFCGLLPAITRLELYWLAEPNASMDRIRRVDALLFSEKRRFLPLDLTARRNRLVCMRFGWPIQLRMTWVSYLTIKEGTACLCAPYTTAANLNVWGPRLRLR